MVVYPGGPWARGPSLLLGVLAMIAGYHFWRATGFFVALILFVLMNVLTARLRQNSEAEEDLRLRAERARDQEPPLDEGDRRR